VAPAGLIIRDLPLMASNWRMTESLAEFLQRGQGRRDCRHRHPPPDARAAREGRPGRLHHDGREPTRTRRACRARVSPASRAWTSPRSSRRASATSGTKAASGARAAEAHRAPQQRLHVVAYDFGIKRNILRLLADQGCRVTVVPAQTSAEEVLRAAARTASSCPTAPGDPEPCDYAVRGDPRSSTDRHPDLRHLPRPPAARPRAARDRQDEVRPPRRQPPGAGPGDRPREITSQNHGFAVDENAAGQPVATHVSLFDGSLQGIARTDRRRSVSRATRKRAPMPSAPTSRAS
jgi:carbamoyl-phosphate synthase small subunit